MTPAAIPVLPRGVRLRFDGVRGRMVLLAPERALMLDDVGAAVLGVVDGVRSLSGIAAHLAQTYDAPESEVLADVTEFLGGLAEERLVDVTHA